MGCAFGIQSDWKRMNNNFLSFSLFVTLERNKCHNITNAPNNVCAYVRTYEIRKSHGVGETNKSSNADGRFEHFL